MSLFREFYNKTIQEARASTVSSVAENQPSYRRGKITDDSAIKEALKKLNLEEFKKLKKNPDDISLAKDVFNIIKGLNDEDLNKTSQTRGELLDILLNVTKTPYHDVKNMENKDSKGVNIIGFRQIAQKYFMNSDMPVQDQIKLFSQVSEWHNLYKNVLQEKEGKGTKGFERKFTEYTKRDLSINPEDTKKIDKADVYYFDRDPSDPDAKPYRTTIIIPSDSAYLYKTQEERELHIPINKSFWNEPRPNKAYGIKLPPPWPLGAYTPKGLRGKTIAEIRDIVNSSDAELAHKALYPPNKHPEMYTMK